LQNPIQFDRRASTNNLRASSIESSLEEIGFDLVGEPITAEVPTVDGGGQYLSGMTFAPDSQHVRVSDDALAGDEIQFVGKWGFLRM
jgi:hypothetical protein